MFRKFNHESLTTEESRLAETISSESLVLDETTLRAEQVAINGLRPRSQIILHSSGGTMNNVEGNSTVSCDVGSGFPGIGLALTDAARDNVLDTLDDSLVAVGLNFTN
jgi:hypothetical protein